jgi:hypothetical protein
MDLRSHRPLTAATCWLIAGAAALALVGVWATRGRTAPGPSASADRAAAMSPRPVASGSSPRPAGASATTPDKPQASAATPGAAQASGAGAGVPASGAAGVTPATRGLTAACTIVRLSRLVSEHRPAAVRLLLADDRVWPRRTLGAIRHIDFISARVWGDSRADAVTLAATVRLAVRQGSALPSGLTTLYFTLGRRGSAGDWLVKAVRTSP